MIYQVVIFHFECATDKHGHLMHVRKVNIYSRPALWQCQQHTRPKQRRQRVILSPRKPEPPTIPLVRLSSSNVSAMSSITKAMFRVSIPLNIQPYRFRNTGAREQKCGDMHRIWLLSPSSKSHTWYIYHGAFIGRFRSTSQLQVLVASLSHGACMYT